MNKVNRFLGENNWLKKFLKIIFDLDNLEFIDLRNNFFGVFFGMIFKIKVLKEF